jgi:hypothetical protein
MKKVFLIGGLGLAGLALWQLAKQKDGGCKKKPSVPAHTSGATTADSASQSTVKDTAPQTLSQRIEVRASDFFRTAKSRLSGAGHLLLGATAADEVSHQNSSDVVNS